ncbi:MAG: nucleotide exchange factor GrpE [Bacteroidetes bacterium]|nr:nucleotide exchange factor GrpE [Bacteroidota bacterium]
MAQKKTKKDIEKEMAGEQEAKQSKKNSSKKSSADKKLKELKEKNDELNDKFLRLYSEFDNYRKRTIKEKMDLQKSASRDLIDDLLPVLDDFERALQTFTDDDATSDIFKGIELIYNKLFNLLSQKGLEPMNSMGTDFNTDYHEAITNIEAGDELKGKVVDVVQKGYLLNGNVLRFAKVVVGS